VFHVLQSVERADVESLLTRVDENGQRIAQVEVAWIIIIIFICAVLFTHMTRSTAWYMLLQRGWLGG